jgi:protein-tyrosine phosphatase
VIDLHSHILPGLDDGAADIEESLAIARSLVEDGVELVAATPHVRDDYPTTSQAMRAALAEVRAAVRESDGRIEVVGGAEIALDRLRDLDWAELSAFGLGGNPRLLLLEYPYHGRPLALAQECDRLRLAGITPVIAHPERNRAVMDAPHELEPLVRAGAVIQLTAASVDGRLGRAAATCARRLLELELAHLLASDAHGPDVRRAGLSAAAEAVGGALGHWLTSSVPAALLADEELPPRPAGLRRSTRRLGRLRR